MEEQSMITVNNLSFSYGKNPFITDMNFSVAKGEIFGFFRTVRRREKHSAENTHRYAADIPWFCGGEWNGM